MSAASVATIAKVLNDHHAVSFGVCNCGWRTEVPFGQVWRQRHEFHQAEMVDSVQEGT